MNTTPEKDEHTGTETTGHEWDGIKELNTPLPSWWVWVFIATIIFSLVYVVLYPAIPLGNDATDGILGQTNRKDLAQTLSLREAERADTHNRLNELSLEDIQATPELAAYAQQGGAAAFADNCAPCHGPGGGGMPGYPVLADDDWIWGGTLEALEETLRAGIRSGHEDERFSEMPGFADVLSVKERTDVAHFVRRLSGLEAERGRVMAGQPIYEEQCAACHGMAGEGVRDMGAPKLNDAIWLYGSSVDEIVAQQTTPQHGVMPSWTGRLDDATIKMLVLYVHELGGGE